MANPLNYIGIIPARFASTRFPGKPLVGIHGKPMIQWVYERASKELETVFVATDDERILRAVMDFGGRAVMTSTSHKSGTDRCAEAVLLAEQECDEPFDVVLNIQGDEPFIEPAQLSLLKHCFDTPGTQIATLVKTAGPDEDIFDPNRPKVILNANHEALYFSRSAIPFFRASEPVQWVKWHPYYLHIGLYGYLKEVLMQITRLPQSPLEMAESLEQLRWIENGYRISVRLTTYDSFGIDTPEDLGRISGV